jgi:hypothetical protein
MRCAVVLLMIVAVAALVLRQTHGVEADGATCNPPYNRPDGTLIRGTGTAEVYLVQDCQKRWITDGISLASHRFDHTVAEVSQAELSSLAGGVNVWNLRAREGTLFSGPDGRGG